MDKKATIKQPLLRKIFRTIGYFMLALFFFTLVRLFVVDFYTVPSNSMEGAILPGDRIMVEKVSFGPRWPQRLFDIPSLRWLGLNQSLRSKMDREIWDYKRWPLMGSVNRDDIIVFNRVDFLSDLVLVKRCRALPGEELEIKGDVLYVDGQPQIAPETVSYTYFSDELVNGIHPSKVTFDSGSKRIEQGFYYHLTSTDLQAISSLERDKLEIAPFISLEDTSYGPVKIPKAGETVNLKKYGEFMDMYLDMLEAEGRKVGFRGDQLIVDGVENWEPAFSKNYYFVLGDNRHQSKDSRYWGLVPEDDIIGKAWKVSYSRSKEEEKVDWSRTLHAIH